MSSAINSILVVDDEASQRQLLRAVLERDYAVVTAADGREAVQLLKQRSFDLVVSDARMPVMSGVELIRWIREHAPETPVVVLTAYGSIQTAVEAIKLGAQDYLTKPLKDPDELRLAVAKALREKSLRDQSLIHEADMNLQFPTEIIAESESMKQVLALALKVARQPATVLLTGESGTGKEVVARFIHRHSPRIHEPFVALNCAALAETLLESELFGHEKGAFTGATQMKRGRFELAHTGSLFLDEIGDMSMNLQAKLLRVLQERQFERVGGSRLINVDVRVISATNRDLARAMDEKAFREDLYYRINVFPIHIPPLRDRREDIVPLAEHFIRRISARMGEPPKPLSPEMQQVLSGYDWPGNVRELQNALERALIVSHSDRMRPDDLPLQLCQAPAAASPATLAEVEKAAILKALAQNQGDRQRTASQLGISVRTLQYRLKEYAPTCGE